MSNLPAREQKQFIQSMFSQIAERYDLMNRIMTAGQDLRWRKKAIKHAHVRAGALVLDLGAGTGDMGRAALPGSVRSVTGLPTPPAPRPWRTALLSPLRAMICAN